MGPKCTTGTYLLFTVVYKWFCTRKQTLRYADVSKKEVENKTKLENFHFILPHFLLQVFDYFFTMSCNNSILIFQQAYTIITQSIFHVDKYYIINVVGMSIEKLFDMWRNYEFSNFHATYSNLFFWSTKLRQPRQCRDSCTYYIIFQKFVISSHIK